MLWEDDVYLKPFLVDDALLHGFVGDDDDDDNEDDECNELISREEVMREFMNNGGLGETFDAAFDNKEVVVKNVTKDFEQMMMNSTVVKGNLGGLHQNWSNKQLRAAREIKNVNESYFGGYGSFGIHREMISDKVQLFF